MLYLFRSGSLNGYLKKTVDDRLYLRFSYMQIRKVK